MPIDLARILGNTVIHIGDSTSGAGNSADDDNGTFVEGTPTRWVKYFKLSSPYDKNRMRGYIQLMVRSMVDADEGAVIEIDDNAVGTIEPTGARVWTTQIIDINDVDLTKVKRVGHNKIEILAQVSNRPGGGRYAELEFKNIFIHFHRRN